MANLAVAYTWLVGGGGALVGLGLVAIAIRLAWHTPGPKLRHRRGLGRPAE